MKQKPQFATLETVIVADNPAMRQSGLANKVGIVRLRKFSIDGKLRYSVLLDGFSNKAHYWFDECDLRSLNTKG